MAHMNISIRFSDSKKYLRTGNALLLIAFFLYSTLPAAAQETLTNANIIALTQAKVGKNIIIEKIKTSDAGFDLTSAALITLKEAKVDDSVVERMLRKSADRLPVVTNQDVIAMTQGKVSRSTILKKIELSKTDFRLGTNDLIELKGAKINDSIIREMMDKKK